MADISIKTNSTNTTPGESSKVAKLPPVEPALKNQFAQGSVPASTQGGSNPTPSLENKSWVKAVAVLAPVILLILVLSVVYFFFIKKKMPPKVTTSQQSSPLTVSSPNPKATPPQLPKVEDPVQANSLKDYFSKVSPNNFKEEFMNLVPKAAGDAYNSYVGAQGDSKFEAARAFYIYLNNPGIDRNNAQLVSFVGDVKADLEKTVGKPLF